MPFSIVQQTALTLTLSVLLTGCQDDNPDDSSDVTRIIYVSPNGTGDGSASAPAALTSGLASATEGDTLHLLAGQYATQHFPITISVNGLTIEGAGVDESILHFDSAEHCEWIRIQANDVRVRDIKIDAQGLRLADESCTNPALIVGHGDQLDLQRLIVMGGQPMPTEGSLALPAPNAYSLIALDNSSSTLAIEHVQLRHAPKHALWVYNASGDVRIANLNIENSGYRGIYLNQVNGAVEVMNNTLDGAINEGIYLRDVTGEASIVQNTVSNMLYQPTVDGGSGIEGGIIHTNTSGVVSTTLRMNTVDIDPQGLNRALSGEPLLDIDGIEVNMLGSARGYALVEDNIVRNTDDDGIDTDTADSAELDIIIRNNTLSGIQDRSISFVATGNGIVRGLIEGNTLAGPTVFIDNDAVDADGIGIRPRQHSNVNVTVRNNTLHQPGRKGIDINMNRGAGGAGPENNAVAVFRFDNNIINHAGQRGLDVQLEDVARASGVVINNIVSGAEGDGIRVRSGAGDNTAKVQRTELSVAVIGNQVSSSAADGDGGIFARAQRESQLCLVMADNQSSNSGANQDYFLRSQQDSILELQGLQAAIAAANPSTPMRDALIASGNTGRDEAFPVRVQNNSVRLPSDNCVFVNGELTPSLPDLTMTVLP